MIGKRAAVGFVSVMVLVGIGVAGELAAKTQDASTNSPLANTKQARFKVEGMSCASCNVTVKVAAEEVDGVTKAGASHAKKTAWAMYDPTKTNPKAIAAAITAAGYPASPVE